MSRSAYKIENKGGVVVASGSLTPKTIQEAIEVASVINSPASSEVEFILLVGPRAQVANYINEVGQRDKNS